MSISLYIDKYHFSVMKIPKTKLNRKYCSSIFIGIIILFKMPPDLADILSGNAEGIISNTVVLGILAVILAAIAIKFPWIKGIL